MWFVPEISTQACIPKFSGSSANSIVWIGVTYWNTHIEKWFASMQKTCYISFDPVFSSKIKHAYTWNLVRVCISNQVWEIDGAFVETQNAKISLDLLQFGVASCHNILRLCSIVLFLTSVEMQSPPSSCNLIYKWKVGQDPNIYLFLVLSEMNMFVEL